MINWDEFKRSAAWIEISATIRERQRMILSQLISPSQCADLPRLAALQAEYATCEWLLQFPDIPVNLEESRDEEV